MTLRDTLDQYARKGYAVLTEEDYVSVQNVLATARVLTECRTPDFYPRFIDQLEKALNQAENGGPIED
jgi:hypothetical protein